MSDLDEVERMMLMGELDKKEVPKCTIFKNKDKFNTIKRNLEAIDNGLILEYVRDDEWRVLTEADDAMLFIHKCRIKNEKLKCAVIMRDGKVLNNKVYDSVESAEYYLERYSNTLSNFRIVKLNEVK